MTIFVIFGSAGTRIGDQQMDMIARRAICFLVSTYSCRKVTNIFSYLQIFKSKNDQERSALPLSLSVATERTDPVIPHFFSKIVGIDSDKCLSLKYVDSCPAS